MGGTQDPDLRTRLAISAVDSRLNPFKRKSSMKCLAAALLCLLLLGPPASGQSGPTSPTIVAPTMVTAKDTPNDGGSSISVSWKASPSTARFRIERAEGAGEFSELDVAVGSATSYKDENAENGKPYRYRIVAIDAAGAEVASEPSNPASSSAQWFNTYYSGMAITIVLFVVTVIWFVRRARRGEHLYVRKIAGLEAVDEAVGRATEMGRAILYVPGTGYISDIATVASLNVLGEVGKKTAQYGTKLSVPVRDPVVFTVAREIVKGSYAGAGTPDTYDPESVHFLTENGLAYASAVSGQIVRDRPAANFFLGVFAAESLILAETGASTGAIQIAGTDATTQLPFFIVSCDYTLIGEELYAASAYLSRDPLMLGALKGEDWGKVFFMVLLVLGTVTALIAGFDFRRVLSTTGY